MRAAPSGAAGSRQASAARPLAQIPTFNFSLSLIHSALRRIGTSVRPAAARRTLLAAAGAAAGATPGAPVRATMAAAMAQDTHDSAPGPHDLLIVGPGVLGSYAGVLWREAFPGATVTAQTNTEAAHDRCAPSTPYQHWNQVSCFTPHIAWIHPLPCKAMLATQPASSSPPPPIIITIIHTHTHRPPPPPSPTLSGAALSRECSCPAVRWFPSHPTYRAPTHPGCARWACPR